MFSLLRVPATAVFTGRGLPPHPPIPATLPLRLVPTRPAARRHLSCGCLAALHMQCFNASHMQSIGGASGIGSGKEFRSHLVNAPAALFAWSSFQVNRQGGRCMRVPGSRGGDPARPQIGRGAGGARPLTIRVPLRVPLPVLVRASGLFALMAGVIRSCVATDAFHRAPGSDPGVQGCYAIRRSACLQAPSTG